MLKARVFASMIVIGLIVPGIGAVHGQNYPGKPIRMITGAAGGSSDFPTRIIAQGISAALGQPVIVDNRAGGATLSSAELVSRALPDGYTLLVAGNSLGVQPLLVKTTYDPWKDFSPVALVSRQVKIVAVNPSLQVNSVKELIALAKAKPGALNFGSGGIGGSGHMDLEIFKDMAGVNIVHVPFMGQPPAITALISGETQVGIIDAGLLTAHIKSGKLRALAVTSLEPSISGPGLPTMASSLPGFETIAFVGVFAPAKTPATIIKRLNEEVVRYIKQPDVTARLLNGGEEVVGGTPEQLAAVMKADVDRKAKVIKALGIKVE